MESKFLYITLTISTIVMVSGDSGFTQACTPGEARLIHGTTSMEGVLEICNDESDWGTVCSRRFYCQEAMVCCRQVGYDFAYSWYTNNTGLNKRPEYGIYDCSGLESSLLDCPHNWYSYYHRRELDNDYYCGQTRVVGVMCGEVSEPKCDTEDDVRLVGGPNESEGQLQMCINENWRDVCSSSTSYYRNIGIIACRQLGYTSRWISASGNRHYYNSSVQPQLYTQLNCYNNYYTNLSYCNSNEVCQNCSGNEMAIKCEFEITDCVCVNNSLRLFGGPSIVEGWLEICIDGIWGRIVNNIEGKTKDFACAKLGFSETGGTVISHYQASRYYGTTNSPAMVKYINCCGHDETFGDCDFEYIATDEYVSHNYLALRCIDGCTHGDIQLTGATRDHEGIVEVCVSGTWRHIGLNEWDDIDANVVCQNLYPGKTYESASAANSSDYERSHRQVFYDYVRCDSYDTSLMYDCSKSGASSMYTGPVAAVYCYPRCSCEQPEKRSVESEIGNFIQQK